jgi:hypothetical protein
MDIQVNSALTKNDSAELDAWIRLRGCDDIDYVIVDNGSVAIHRKGPRHAVMSALAVRYKGRLGGALDEALATLHNTP